MEKCIPSYLFPGILLQKLSYIAVCTHNSVIQWYTHSSIVVSPWKNQKYLFTNLFTLALQMKLFLLNNIAFTGKCTMEKLISCTIFFL